MGEERNIDLVECRVCGAMVGRMGIGSHAGVHKREFRELQGYIPTDYDEVVQVIGRLALDGEYMRNQETQQQTLDGSFICLSGK